MVLAGHNGSGKSTMWHEQLSSLFQMPLINADRMMMSILPEPGQDGRLVPWASRLRDEDRSWMAVAQQGIQAFVAQAMGARVPFAMETVFSHLRDRGDGTFESKIDLIRDMQRAGYFVLLLFVGLVNESLSVLRVKTRIARGGHSVPEDTLRARFPRTQRAIQEAIKVADASLLADNSRDEKRAFTVCRVQIGDRQVYDCRVGEFPPPALSEWLTRVAPDWTSPPETFI